MSASLEEHTHALSFVVWIEITLKHTLHMFDKASFLGLLFRSIRTKDWIKGEQMRGPYESSLFHVQGRHHPSHRAWEQTMILLHDWNLLWDKNIFLQRSLCFIILLKHSHLLEIFLKLSGTQGTEIFFNFSKFRETLKFPMFCRCNLAFSFLVGFSLIQFLILKYIHSP